MRAGLASSRFGPLCIYTMDRNIIITVLVYLAGYFLCRKMLRIEHDSEKEAYTHGTEIMLNILSMLSFLMIMWMLIRAWIGKINDTGYFTKEINPKNK